MRNRRPLLRRIAEEVYGPEYANKLWKRIEIIGDIAVIRVPFDTDPNDLKPLANAILERIPYIRSVWAGLPGVEGAYRLRKYVHLAGEKRSETIYREHGCMFKIDITKAYISPRLNYEHIRIARLVKPGEAIVNMFAGVGLFSIIIAKHSRPSIVYSIDINPDAYRFMAENIKLNRVEDRVIPILGDAAKVIEDMLTGKAVRVLMPLPELALDYLPHAVKALRGGRGYIHVYLHVRADKGENPLEKASNLVSTRLHELGKQHSILFMRKVRTVGPRRYQVVVDVRVG